jgi:hypothetical protein
MVTRFFKMRSKLYKWELKCMRVCLSFGHARKNKLGSGGLVQNFVGKKF